MSFLSILQINCHVRDNEGQRGKGEAHDVEQGLVGLAVVVRVREEGAAPSVNVQPDNNV